jgi:hypothetical protein
MRNRNIIPYFDVKSSGYDLISRKNSQVPNFSESAKSVGVKSGFNFMNAAHIFSKANGFEDLSKKNLQVPNFSEPSGKPERIISTLIFRKVAFNQDNRLFNGKNTPITN